MDHKKFITTCPLCKIGFPIIPGNNSIDHVDFMWTNDGGIATPCLDPETLKGMDRVEIGVLMRDLSSDFFCYGENYSIKELGNKELGLIIGSFLRYSPAMENRDMKSDITIEQIDSMWEQGFSVLDICHSISQPIVPISREELINEINENTILIEEFNKRRKKVLRFSFWTSMSAILLMILSASYNGVQHQWGWFTVDFILLIFNTYNLSNLPDNFD